jgi:hypothetical protein
MTERNEDFPAAARRCFADGKLLLENVRFPNASHLSGLGAECALKALLEGHPEVDLKQLHLPQIRDYALKTLSRKRDNGVQQLLNKNDYMDGWRIENRYWPDVAFSEERCKLHRDHCRRTLIAANLGS